MLTKKDVDILWYKQSKYILNDTDETIGNSKDRQFIIVNHNTWRLVAICKYAATANALNAYNTYVHAAKINPEYFSIKLKDVWKFIKHPKNHSWSESLNFKTDQELYETLLMNQKAYALDTMLATLDNHRYVHIATNDIQSYIYTAKYEEARRVIDNNIDNDTLCEFPLVTGYANTKNISIKEAAKHIVFQHDMQCSFLAETENIRIKYKKLVLEQDSIEGVKNIFNQYMVELLGYGFI